MKRGERGGIFLRLISLLFFLAFLAFIYVVRRPLLRLAGDLWVLDEPAAHSDVIIVLSDDNYVGDRAAHAAELYVAGLAPQVVASGRLLRPYAGIAELMERDLESRGVPATAIVKFPHKAANTREEAEALTGLVTSHGWKRVLVVTSNYHARRTRFIFERVFRSGITVHVSAAHDSDFDPSRWWETRLGTKLFFNEAIGFAVAWWELRGKPSAASGAIFLPLTPVASPTMLGKGPAFDAASHLVSDWEHSIFREISSFTAVSSYIIVTSLPSSPGCFAFPPSHVATEFRLRGTHVA
jgi:uncharacterized SAM-binding protein YcdF (DUF218 family)